MSGAKHNKRGNVKVKHGGISNNLLALISIMFMAISISCSIVVYMGTEPEKPMAGFLTSQDTAEISITIIGNPPNITINQPQTCQVVSGSFVMNATADDPNGVETIANVSFYYRKGGSGWNYVGSDSYDSDNLYDAIWDTLVLEDDIDYMVQVTALDASDLTAEENTGVFAINNIDTEPDWTDFKYNVSTNLSLLSSWDDISGLMLGNPYGFINFSDRVVNIDGLNLSEHFSISSNRFMLDESGLPCVEGGVFLHFFNTGIIAPNIYRNGVPCPGSVCTLVSNDQSEVVIHATGFATYELVNNANHDIWDITDANRTPGGQIRYKNQQVEFFLNLTADGIAINSSDIRCFARFNQTEPVFKEMRFSNRSLYEYNRSFSAPGTYLWEVYCNSTDSEYFSIYGKDNVTISNRAPRLIKDLPNITMEEDTVAQYINDLNDYFQDMEGDEMTFTVSNIPNVATTVAHDTILIRPERNWYGERTFVVYATDEFGLQNISNLVYLKVVDMPEPPQLPGGGGGGGGGGSSGLYDDEDYDERESPECDDEWICSAWSACIFRWAWNSTPEGMLETLMNLGAYDENEGIMTRSCSDKSHCNYWWKKPNETQQCYYLPRCNDNIKNGNETGVDCGGPCPSCFSCSDKILNQGEEDVDCGGPCPACGNCNDGKMNCHGGSCELGTDCGGPCANTCSNIESPAPSFNLMTLLLVGLLMLALFFTFYLFVRPYVVRIYIWLIAIRDRKEEEPEPTLLEIGTNYLKMLERLKKKAEKANVADVSGELNSIFRKFLMEAFKLKTEATLEDLSGIIKGSKLPGMLKIALTTYIREIVQIGYSSAKVGRDEMISKIERAKELLNLVVRHMPKEEEAKSAGKTKAKPTEKKKAEEKKRVPKRSGGSPRLRAPRLADAYKLGIEAKRALLRDDFESAMSFRNEMVRISRVINESEREQVIQTIGELDKELLKARADEKKGDKN